MQFQSLAELNRLQNTEQAGAERLETLMELRALVGAQRDLRTEIARLPEDNAMRSLMMDELRKLSARVEVLSAKALETSDQHMTYVGVPDPQWMDIPRVPDQYLALAAL